MDKRPHGGGTSVNRGNNRLMLLYEAAMLLEQRDTMAVARFPPANTLTRPMPMHLRLKLPYNSAALKQQSTQNQQKQQQKQKQQQHQQPLLHQRLVPVPANSALIAHSQHSRRQVQDTSRSSHNELEKNRRVHLRQCLDCLRDHLPLSQGQACRLTMLNVLNKSLGYIRELECQVDSQRERIRAAVKRRQELQRRRASLLRAQRHLKRRVDSAKAALIAAATVNSDEAWRSRNSSEISAASTSSDYSTGAPPEDSPDSGYDSPQNFGALPAAAAVADTL